MTGAAGAAADDGPIAGSACQAGFYLGTYDCEIPLFGLPVPLSGDVSFNLSVNEDLQVADCPPTGEFCPDLVISESSGTLFGLAGRDRIRDAARRRARLPDGRVSGHRRRRPLRQRDLDRSQRPGRAVDGGPPADDMFDGELEGMREPGTAGGADAIEGMWNLTDITLTGITCEGPFRVEQQP